MEKFMERGRKKKDKTKDTQLHIAVARKDKEEATRILEECGTTINSVVEMLLKYIINHKGIPFAVELPKDMEIANDLTQETTTVSGMLEKDKAVDIHLDEEISEEDIESMKPLEYDSSDDEEGLYDFDNLFEDEEETSEDMETLEKETEDNDYIGDDDEEIALLKSFLSTV